MRAKVISLAALTLIAQRAVGTPGLPMWPSEILFPTAVIVAAVLRSRERHWPYEALLLGLGWDLLLEPVVGPSGIAWSAAALCLQTLASIVANRSTTAWMSFGAVAAFVITLVHELTLLPLGLGTSMTVPHLVRTIILSGLWCGLVNTVLVLDIPARWRTYRVRKLR
jgi:hypothetical protein